MYRSPHIVLIVLDCVRAQNLSCYGYKRPTTPNIDRVAEEGVCYRQAATVGTWTVPTHATLFTGTYPATHGAVNGHAYLDNHVITLTEVLKRMGYVTVGVSNNGWVSRATGIARGFDAFEEKYRMPRGLRRRLFSGYRRMRSALSPGEKESARRTRRSVLRWLKHMAAEDRPYFLFIHLNDAHSPYAPPPPFARRFLGDTSLRLARKVNQDNTAWLAGAAEMDEQDWALLTALYDGELAYLDHQVASFLSAMRELNLLDRTLLIITADHGENLGEHGLIGHGYCLYDTIVRIPLLIRYPPLFSGGQVVDTPVSLVDLFPTVVDVIEGDPGDAAAQWKGASFHPDRLDHRPYPFTVSVRQVYEPVLRKRFAPYPSFDLSPYARSAWALRDGKWKYILHENGEEELYDLEADPNELQNLATEHPQQAVNQRKQLLSVCDSWRAPVPEEKPEPEWDEELVEHLRGLGYIA
ncbi:MAG: sulfatase [Anaerolineae bacterium]|nr:sulfatase [Anaerolineae bacterium]